MAYIQGTLPPFPLPNDYEDFSSAVDNWSIEAAKYIETNMETVRKAVQEVIWEPGTLDHGALEGLTDIADHDWALLKDGTRSLTGNWDVGGYDITNIGTGTFGKVGIGTTSPDSIFHIKANVAGTVGSHPAGQLIIQDPDDTVFGNAVITGYESDGAGNPDQQLWYLGSSSSSNSNIIFLNRRNSKLQLGTNGVSHLTILGNGNIGIGTSTPSEKLDVVGNATVSGTLSAGATTVTTLKTHANAITSGSEISYKTAALTPLYAGILEIISDASNLLPAGTEAGIEVEAFFDPDDSVTGGYQFAGAFFNKATGTAVDGLNNQRGLFGGYQGTVVNDGVYNLYAYGIQFDCFNNANFDGGKGLNLTTRGVSVSSYLGYDTKTISNAATTDNRSGYFDAILDGTYDSSVAGTNCGICAKTTDSLTNADGDITSYGLYIDALTGSTKGGGGVITSWGLYEANGIDNALAGNLRIGSTTAPTVALDVTGAALISTTLDVVGNIDPTTFETTRGGFLNAIAAPYAQDKVVSEHGIQQYVQSQISDWTQSVDVDILSYAEIGIRASLANYVGGPINVRYIDINDDFTGGGFFGVQVPIPANWDAASDITINMMWIIVNDQGARTVLDVKAVVMSVGSGDDIDGLGTQTLTDDHTWAGANTAGNVELVTLTIDYDDGGAPLAAGDMLKIQYGRGEHAAFPDAGKFDGNSGALCMWLDYTRKAAA